MKSRQVLIAALIPAVMLITAAAGAEVLRVGVGKRFAVPSAAAKAAKDGDVIEIDAGTYEGDVAIWTRNNLTIRGVGGRAHLKANGAHAQGKGIWVIQGRDTTVESIEFSGARVPDRNGAGIRQEGPGLTLRDCYFHDNENGILGGGGEASHVVIENSEFAGNGHGDGQSHNIYISRARSFTLRGSYSHHAKVGHNVKSRAVTNYILYNRIMDETTGTSSYALDLPKGGVSYVIGNLVQQGPDTENTTIISYGAEGFSHPVNELYVVNNTIVNDHPSSGRFLYVRAGAHPVKILNNLFVGPGTVLTGPGELSHNLASPKPGLVDRGSFDYRLRGDSPAIDAGGEVGLANEVPLTPVAHYVHRATPEPRRVRGRLDIGAYEYEPPVHR